MALEGDHRLGEGEGEHVARAAGGEDGQRHAVELGVVDLLEHERSDRQGADAADDADADDEDEQAPQPVAELGEVAGCGEAAEPGEQRRLHGLEHEQRDAGEQHAVAELGDLLPAASAVSSDRMLTSTGPALSSAAAKTDPSNSHPRFGVTSFHDASGPSAASSAGPSMPRSRCRPAATGR